MKIAVVCANEKAGKLIVAEAVERGQGQISLAARN